MIKRYGLGANPEGLTLGSMRPSLVQMVERKDGDYVRYEDYAAAMESIGAGGVSGRITGKSIKEHRLEFNDWFLQEQTIFDPVAISAQPGKVTWEAWKAARGISE